MLAIIAESMNIATRVEPFAPGRKSAGALGWSLAPTASRPAISWSRRWADRIRTWRRARRERRQLAQLDRRMLADIGLSEADVAIEIARPFYDVGMRR